MTNFEYYDIIFVILIFYDIFYLVGLINNSKILQDFQKLTTKYIKRTIYHSYACSFFEEFYLSSSFHQGRVMG